MDAPMPTNFGQYISYETLPTRHTILYWPKKQELCFPFLQNLLTLFMSEILK